MTSHPAVTVIMPVYNTARYVKGAVNSVLQQTFHDFELLIIDDAGTDNSVALCREFDDPRIRIISQKNRGLAGARNTGIRYATGEFLAFLDSDDFWAPEKLARHVEHLRRSPSVGISFCASILIDDDGELLRVSQRPKLRNIRPHDVFQRNPIGNGSVPVIRREVFYEIAFPNQQGNELDYFDESFRQSEDIECWSRIALTTEWTFEGIKGAYTYYRINEGGLSADVVRQFETWSRVRNKVVSIAPEFAQKWAKPAEAFQLRYLARRSVRLGDGGLAFHLIVGALRTCPGIIFKEPAKTATTLVAALAMRYFPDLSHARLQAAMKR